MAQLELVDHTWIRADRTAVARVVDDPARWRRWWPDLNVDVSERRGDEGLRWRVAPRGYAGTMEVYLAADLDGVLLHYLLSLDPVDGRRLGTRPAERLGRSYTRRAKRIFWAVKDEVERVAR